MKTKPLQIFATFLFLILLSSHLKAHSISDEAFSAWHPKNKTSFKGNFFFHRNDSVFFNVDNSAVYGMPLTDFSGDEKSQLLNKINRVETIQQEIQSANIQNIKKENVQTLNPTSNFNGWIPLVMLSLIFAAFVIIGRKFAPVAFSAIIIFVLSSFGGNNVTKRSTTNPQWMDSSFSYFKPDIYTRWDNTYFYVESSGLPNHEMMTGITSWQQQVPIPQCYVGTNAWSIPLNPEIAATPVPVNNKHFLRGAIAIAANGIAIFNPYTNTGVDAFLDGQLDIYGGHSGRADDYHYHIAPTVLYNTLPKNYPVAFALDGFAIYGSLEPDGSAMKTLDANHGHYGTNGVYHYHSSSAAPYMIANMVGKVKEDTTLQIVPQATAKPVRPSLTPLKGAVLTHFYPNGTGNGYILTYTVGTDKDTLFYSWTSDGKYTYTFSTNGTHVVQNYNGSKLCKVTSAVNVPNKFNFRIYPNPSTENVTVQWDNAQAIQLIQIYSVNGTLMRQTLVNQETSQNFSTSDWSKGTYFVRLIGTNTNQVAKILVQ